MKATFLTLLLAASAICRASTTYTVNETITLSSASIGSSAGHEFYNQTFGVASPVTVQAGDVITGAFTFIGGPILMETPSGDTDESLVAFFSPTSGSPSLGETFSLTFQGLNGTYPGANSSGGSGGCCFIAEEYSNGGAYDFSFTGFTYTIDVTSVSTGSTSVYFSQFSLGAQLVEFGTAIPEPSTMMLCGIGFLALGWGAAGPRVRRCIN